MVRHSTIMNFFRIVALKDKLALTDSQSFGAKCKFLC